MRKILDSYLFSWSERVVEGVGDLPAHEEADVRPDPVMLVNDPEAQARVAGIQDVEEIFESGGVKVQPGPPSGVRTKGRRNEGTALVKTENRLALDGAGEARDVVLDEERIDQGHGNGAEEGPGHELAPEIDVAADQLRHDTHRD